MTKEITKQNTLVPDAVAGLTTGIANMMGSPLFNLNFFFGNKGKSNK
jgi:hypothetical protein